MLELKEATAEEQLLIDKMRQNLKDLKLGNDQLDTKDLVRFLRARNQCPDKAAVMFRKQLEFRVQYNMDHIMEWQIPPEYKRYWPCYTSGLDFSGNPVVVFEKGLWDPSKVKELSPKNYLRYNLYNMEWVVQLARHLSQGQKAMKQCTIIMDMKGLGWRNITTLDYMQANIEAFQHLEANFPEMLYVCFILNAPYVFHIAFNITKPFMSAYTQSKIQLLSGSDKASWREEIGKVADVSQFPQRFGGDLHDSAELKIETPWIPSSARQNDDKELISCGEVTKIVDH